jgi:FkbM family methyltransferase
MEGNACYKLSTIKNFITMTHADEVKIIVDIGVNVGDVSLLMYHYFPAARMFGFEAVKEYFDLAMERTKDITNITLYNEAVTAQHRFFDDFGEKPRHTNPNLTIMKGMPAAGPGWQGGSRVVPDDHDMIANGSATDAYLRIPQPVTPITLEEFMQREHIAEIDILKLDCEGCEHSVLGCADLKTLRRLRFITGEYHGIARFSEIMQRKLFLTHKVNLIGQHDLGCFFAERLDGQKDGILRYDKSGMLFRRPWLSDAPIEWHLFNEQFVLPADRYWHALP